MIDSQLEKIDKDSNGNDNLQVNEAKHNNFNHSASIHPLFHTFLLHLLAALGILQAPCSSPSNMYLKKVSDK
jgi:hypothetical protein